MALVKNRAKKKKKDNAASTPLGGGEGRQARVEINVATPRVGNSRTVDGVVVKKFSPLHSVFSPQKIGRCVHTHTQ